MIWIGLVMLGVGVLLAALVLLPALAFALEVGRLKFLRDLEPGDPRKVALYDEIERFDDHGKEVEP